MSDGSWVPAAVGFLAGGVILRGIDFLLPHIHPAMKPSEAEVEGISTSWRRSTLLVLAITLHNIPEGLAVGVAFGAAGQGIGGATLAGAVALALGIGIQNFPEGTAVAMPLRREGLSPHEVLHVRAALRHGGAHRGRAGRLGGHLHASLLPYALAFAAGAMIFVVGEELIPESQSQGNGHLATAGDAGLRRDDGPGRGPQLTRGRAFNIWKRRAAW